MIWLNEEELNGNLTKNQKNPRAKTYSLRFRKDERKADKVFITATLSKPFTDHAQENELTEFALGVDAQKRELYLKLTKPDKKISTLSLLNSKGAYRSLIGATAIYESLEKRTENSIPLNQKIIFTPDENDHTLFIHRY